jgi:hypothetical protein
MLDSKKLRGQYYTTTNPFSGSAFSLWDSMRPHNVPVIEPFAGAGNLFSFLTEEWCGYDIEPQHEDVIQLDTLKDFPTGYQVAITNPPYLAKNSLKRRGGTLFFKYEDLYLDCLEKMLDNCGYVAAIIPSTFFGTGMFQDRLLCWDKLDYVLFEDTDCPVGVAYFIPDKCKTKLFVNGERITPHNLERNKTVKLRFNVSDGNYVLSAIDNTKHENIRIDPLSVSFNREKYLKNTSRNYVLFHSDKELDCDEINRKISEWRVETQDFYLTSFKSMMKCGKYRKRISFKDLYYFV